MLRPQVAPAGAQPLEAEVRGLVPAVAGRGQRVDDLLEVPLHRVRLARELLAVGVREARPRLRLELVAGEVLRLQRDRLGEVCGEIGGALARDAVDEIEREVVEPGSAESAHGTPDVLGRGLPLEHVQQSRLEALRAERHARDAVRSEKRRDLGGHRLGIRLDRHLPARAAAQRAAARARAAR